MKCICDRRMRRDDYLRLRCLWPSLVICTIAVCAVIVYISLLHGVSHSSESKDYFFNSPEKLSDEKCPPMCVTKECLYKSNSLLKNIDPAADPCDNYFEFACGKLVKKFGGNETRRFATLQFTEVHQRLKRILDNIKSNPNSAIGKVKVVYDTCLKEISSEIQAIPILQEFLRSAGIPNWPHLSQEFRFKERNLTDVLGKFLSHQYYGFINFERESPYLGVPSEENRDSKNNITITLRNGAYHVKEKYIRKYFLERILKYFEFDSAYVDEIWDETEALNEAVMLLREAEVKEENGISITCGKDAETRWELACKLLDSFINSTGVNEAISKQFVEINYDAIYFTENIFQVLKNFSDRSIANYLVFNLLLEHLDDLNFYFRLTSRYDPMYTNAYINLWPDLTPWHHCIVWLTTNMQAPLVHEYVKDYSMGELTKANSLIREIIQEAADRVLKQDWIKKNVSEGIAEKIRNITLLHEKRLDIFLMDEAAIDDFYKEFHPTNTSFLRNVFEHNRFSVYEETLRRNKLALFLPSGRIDNFFVPAALGGGGTIDITLGIFLPPVYRPGLESALNLVSLSVLVAHEVGHNFVSICEEEILLHEVDPEARDFLDETRVCLENQYSLFKYEIIGRNANGSNQLRENFADTFGISILDSLIEKYSSSNESFLLPGISYTPRQMLYISALETWCELDTEKDEIHNYEKDSHGLGRFRMLGMLQNSKGFSKAFNCRPGSYMDPVTKCTFPK